MEKEAPVDAQDAACGRGLCLKGGPADAHDAGCGRGFREKKEAQLMLMMLGMGAACGKKEA